MALTVFDNDLDTVLDGFDRKYRGRTVAYLAKSFALSREDCEDVVQESYISLVNNVHDGMLDNVTSSLYTYFIGICKNKAHELLRSKSKLPLLIPDNDLYDSKTEILEQNATRLLEVAEYQEHDYKELVIQRVVQDLPSPCGELLWSYYRDCLSMKTIATMFGYANENSAKVTKHRCQERFRKHYEQVFENAETGCFTLHTETKSNSQPNNDQ